MANAIVSLKPSQIIGRVAELVRMLEEAGLNYDDLQKPISDRKFRRGLVEFWKSGKQVDPLTTPRRRKVSFGPALRQLSAHHQWVQQAMGQRFFGIEDWVKLYGISLSAKQLEPVAQFPWSEEVLNGPCQFHSDKVVAQTHVAFLGLDRIGAEALTTMHLHKLNPPTGQPRLYFDTPRECWYREEEFATQVACSLRWYLLLAEVVPGSNNKWFADQETMLPAEYEIPLAVEETAKDLLYIRKSGQYLNSSVWARCRDTSSGGGRVDVGDGGPRGFGVDYWDDRPDPLIGIAASRKLPTEP